MNIPPKPKWKLIKLNVNATWIIFDSKYYFVPQCKVYNVIMAS